MYSSDSRCFRSRSRTDLAQEHAVEVHRVEQAAAAEDQAHERQGAQLAACPRVPPPTLQRETLSQRQRSYEDAALEQTHHFVVPAHDPQDINGENDGQLNEDGHDEIGHGRRDGLVQHSGSNDRHPEIGGKQTKILHKQHC